MKFFEIVGSAMPSLLQGLLKTLEITAVSLVFATMIGLLLCMMQLSNSKVLGVIARIYVDCMRGLPVMVLSFFIYFGVAQALSIRISSDVASVMTLALNAGAYLSEIFRGGIQAVNIGQMEAARSLGLPYGRAMRKVILPQAIRIVIPSMVNQFIITLKDTSILSIIGMVELTQSGKLIIARNFKSFEIWLTVGVIYIVVITILSRVSRMIERRMAVGNR
ncbi:MAG: amino acid ABC transporter permease [Pygmaiobacter sp.]|nr:amino acid ABC transporter permease [Pygmaiobacter sp.]